MSANLALDTCVLSDMSFMAVMSRVPAVHLVVPAVVYMERRRQLLNHGKDPADPDRLIEKAHITVSIFDKSTAKIAAELMNS